MILDQFRLEGRVALVTGTHQGLGRAIACALAEAGADIVAVDRSEPAEACAAVGASGRRFHWLKADLGRATPADLASLVNEAIHQTGRLDILVNNAGVIRRTPALEYSEADWDEVIRLNLKTTFFLSQAAARHFARQKRGKIIHLASLLSFQGGILIAAYTAAKSGVAGLTRSMANEWAPLGINVNAIAPGYMETTLTEKLRTDPERNNATLARIPAGRWGHPTELAGAAVFLASPASDYVHGVILPVDGGWLAR